MGLWLVDLLGDRAANEVALATRSAEWIYTLADSPPAQEDLRGERWASCCSTPPRAGLNPRRPRRR